MDVHSLRSLLQPQGHVAVAEAEACRPTEERFLTCLNQLQKRHGTELAKAALELVLVRRRAVSKYPRWAARLFATREALEQASGEVVALYRATRYQPYAVVADLTCGLGADALALALSGRQVEAIDTDPLRVALCTANAQSFQVMDHLVVRHDDALRWQPPSQAALWVDPGRRCGQKRSIHPEKYQPSLAALFGRWGADSAWGVKLAPGLPSSALTPYLPHAEVEFISVAGELKECVLWFGPLRTCERRATVLQAVPADTAARRVSANTPSGTSPLFYQPAAVSLPWSGSLPPCRYAPLANYVYLPCAAVVRAGLLDALALQLQAARLHPRTTLLTGPVLATHPLAVAYRLWERIPADRKQLRRAIQKYQLGRLELIQCGSSLDAAFWHQTLQQVMQSVSEAERSSHPSTPASLLLTHDSRQPCLLLAERLGSSQPDNE